jgi:hypothetical protein
MNPRYALHPPALLLLAGLLRTSVMLLYLAEALRQAAIVQKVMSKMGF